MRAAADRIAELVERSRRKGMVLGLGAMRAGLAALGDPHRGLRCVHIGGTNGKGSTSAMVESIARAAGLRTGLYTSPHLCKIGEVVRVDGEALTDDRLAEVAGRVLDACPELTFFEVMTAAAFVAFAEAGVDLAIVEVGLGGGEDATNVIEAPLVTAITGVAIDHTRILGADLASIARAKAGIAKAGAPLVLGVMPAEAEAVIEAHAREVGAGPVWRVRDGASEAGDVVGVAPGEGGAGVHIARAGGEGVSVTPGLRGFHQGRNAGVAAGIGWRLSERWPQVSGAIAEGIGAVRWAGRFEAIDVRGRYPEAAARGVRVILDCAHNVDGATALARAAREEGLTSEGTVLVFGALSDKQHREMLGALRELACRRVYTCPKGRHPASLDVLARDAPGLLEEEPARAMDAAVAMARPGDAIVVAGSIYLIGEVRALLLGIERDPIIAY